MKLFAILDAFRKTASTAPGVERIEPDVKSETAAAPLGLAFLPLIAGAFALLATRSHPPSDSLAAAWLNPWFATRNLYFAILFLALFVSPALWGRHANSTDKPGVWTPLTSAAKDTGVSLIIQIALLLPLIIAVNRIQSLHPMVHLSAAAVLLVTAATAGFLNRTVPRLGLALIAGWTFIIPFAAYVRLDLFPTSVSSETPLLLTFPSKFTPFGVLAAIIDETSNAGYPVAILCGIAMVFCVCGAAVSFRRQQTKPNRKDDSVDDRQPQKNPVL
ncbi:MAG: hypothetical protein ABIH86_03275 [Planctomycetota bacterium]